MDTKCNDMSSMSSSESESGDESACVQTAPGLVVQEIHYYFGKVRKCRKCQGISMDTKCKNMSNMSTCESESGDESACVQTALGLVEQKIHHYFGKVRKVRK